MPRPSRLALLTTALLVLLPALAVLQYRWVGQVRDAERDRMQRNVRTAAGHFRDALDGEIARAFVSLQMDAASAREDAWDRYAERYAAWAGTTANPQIVADVFLIDARDTALRLRRWNAQASRFEPGSWDGPLAAARAHFAEELAAFTSGGKREEVPSPFRDDESLLVAPLLNVHLGRPPPRPLVTIFGFTVVHLNMPFIREQMVPSLAKRHFMSADGEEYRVAVIDTKDPKRVIYRSSPDAPTSPREADASEAIFGMHRDPLMFIARGAVREAHETRRNIVVSVLRRDGVAAGDERIFEHGIGRWTLVVRHERGSLDAAVGRVRTRNLGISFGILLLMALSVGLLAISSRRAQRLAQQQMEFVAGVSHELRTPVAVIRSAAENLSHGVVADEARVRKYGETIEAEARRLGEMVERVLQLAGIESGRGGATRAPVAPAALVEAALESAAHALGDGITVERSAEENVPLVAADPVALQSAIENLITNAAKYGGPDRWIGVRVTSAAAGRGRDVRIAVEDHGSGIAPADLPHVFEPFYRGANAIGRQVQGSGLGLSLVRRIVEAHGGRVSVASRPGATTFTIQLPAAEPTTDPLATGAPAAAHS